MKNQSLICRFWKNHNLRFVIFGAIIATLPLFVSAGIVKTSWLGIVGGAIIYTVAALGLNLLLGYSGLVSLGTAGFMGLGAYISAFVTMDMGLPWELGILAAVVISLILGIIVGLVSLRVEGLYLGIITLCVAEVLRKTFDEVVAFTGGFAGKSPAYPTLLGFLELNQRTTYVLLAVVLVLMMMLTWNLVHGQIGRAFHAMRGSQVAAQAMGVSLFKYRLMAFSLATGYISLAGALYGHFIRFIFPSTWNVTLSLTMIAIIVVGGLRSIYGTFLGAIIVYALPDLLLKRIPVIGEMNGFAYVFSGVLIIVVVLFYPRGAVNVFNDLKKLFGRLTGKKEVKERVQSGDGAKL